MSSSDNKEEVDSYKGNVCDTGSTV